MTDPPEQTVMGSLPTSRPHRRSAKRPARPGAEPAITATATEPGRPKPTSARAKPASAQSASTGPGTKPAGSGSAAPPSAPEPAAGVLETAVQAAAELAEIGLRAGARALRGAVSRLPRP